MFSRMDWDWRCENVVWVKSLGTAVYDKSKKLIQDEDTDNLK